MSEETVFTKKVDTGYRETDVEVNYNEFKKVVDSRRSVRVFSDELVADSVIENALDDALKAPNSSNLQPWQFFWIKSPEAKKELAKYCFSQNGAKTANHLIVCVAKTGTWKEHCALTIEQMEATGMEVPAVVRSYYTKLAPSAYGMMGPFGIFSPIKWLLYNIVGITKVMIREPVWPSDLKTWAVKSTALACENIMLSVRAQGYDTLPMEGFDAKRVRKMLKLSCTDHPMMVIGVGQRAPEGIYGPQMRFDKARFISKL